MRVRPRKENGWKIEEEIRRGALSMGASTPEGWIRLDHGPKSARVSGSQGEA